MSARCPLHRFLAATACLLAGADLRWLIPRPLGSVAAAK